MTQKLGTPNVVAALAYLGGALTGIVVLLVEKKDQFVRFHAMQSTVTFLLVLVANLLLRNVPVVGRFAVLSVGRGRSSAVDRIDGEGLHG